MLTFLLSIAFITRAPSLEVHRPTLFPRPTFNDLPPAFQPFFLSFHHFQASSDLEAVPVVVMIIARTVLEHTIVTVNHDGCIVESEPDPGILHTGELHKSKSTRLPRLLVPRKSHVLKARPRRRKHEFQLLHRCQDPSQSVELFNSQMAQLTETYPLCCGLELEISDHHHLVRLSWCVLFTPLPFITPSSTATSSTPTVMLKQKSKERKVSQSRISFFLFK